MKYTISKTGETFLVKAAGRIDRVVVLGAGNFARSLVRDGYRNITLDIDELEDEREMIYHVALVNAFKNSVEQAGGVFRLVSTRASMRSYLAITGIQRLFVFSDRKESIA